jgi:two-component system chemotaxis response regulator CheY
MAYNFLLIDDSNIVRKVLIKTMGMTTLPIDQIIEAENGKVGFEKLEHQWIDMIFLDINMPVMNGIEFMEKLREHETYKTLPVVIVSTEGSQERIKRLEELGIKAYLRKPVTPEDLTTTIETLLGGTTK